MEMRAYLSDYVPYAQRILGDMLDFAVNTCDMDIDEYFELFTVSSVSTQFQNGNPTYIAGKTGCELVREVIADAGMEPLSVEDEMYLDKSPEYWAGWALAYYQWYTCRTFIKIHKAVSLKQIVSMYGIYHEMDITHFIDTMNELWTITIKKPTSNASVNQPDYLNANYPIYPVSRCAKSSFLNSGNAISTTRKPLML